MKTCPKCSRVYADDALNFCLDDGEWLVASDISEPVTAILSGDTPSEAKTRAQVTTTYPNSDPSTISGAAATNAKSYEKLALIIGSIAVVAILAIGAYKYVGSTPKTAPLSFEKAKLTRLTTTGKATNAAISPDGKLVVHVQDDGGQQSLWVRQTATPSNVQIVAPAPVSYDSLTFTPDGNYVYYSVSGQGFPQRALFQISTLGGTPKKILEDLDDDTITFSPDGRQFVFDRVTPRGEQSSLVIVDASGGNEHTLASVSRPAHSVGWPAWSPDGDRVAYVLRNYETNESTLFEIPIAGGDPRQISSQTWLRAIRLQWLSNGKGLLLLGTPGQNFVYQIWHLSYPSGEARQLTNDLNDYEALSLTANSASLAAVKFEIRSNIWVTSPGESSHARQVTSGTGDEGHTLAWTADGRIVFSSVSIDAEDLWMVGTEGGEPIQLTSNARINRHPTVSADGSSIVFLSDRTGTPHLWKMNLDGSNQSQLTNISADGEQTPQFSPDGRWLFYAVAQSGRDKRSAWRMPADGSAAPVRVVDKLSSHPTVSPDSRNIAYFYKDNENAPWRVAVAPTEGGPPTKSFDLPPTFDGPLRWTRDGRSIAYIDTRNGVSNIVAQPLNGGQPKPLTDFKFDRIFWFDISRDGKQIAISRGTQSSDVVLISGF